MAKVSIYRQWWDELLVLEQPYRRRGWGCSREAVYTEDGEFNGFVIDHSYQDGERILQRITLEQLNAQRASTA